MDDLTDDEWYGGIRALVDNDDEGEPELEDLPARWDALDPDVRDPVLPIYSLRHTLVVAYHNFAFTRWWAWDGLDRLHKVLMERGEVIPEMLQLHVNFAYADLRKPPRKPRNPRYKPQDARDMRIHARLPVHA